MKDHNYYITDIRGATAVPADVIKALRIIATARLADHRG
jgi:hypothetical protein